MKISVDGHLIDTDKIYQIAPVIGNNTWNSDDELDHSGFGFDINFFNEKTLKISLHGDQVFKMEDNLKNVLSMWWTEDYKKKREIIFFVSCEHERENC